MKNLNEFGKTFVKLTEVIKEQGELMLSTSKKFEENSKKLYENVKKILNASDQTRPV